MRQSADLSGLSSRRSLLVVTALLAALTASVALYFSLGVQPATAQQPQLQCGYEQKHIRNQGGHNSQRIPIFAIDCREHGFMLDHFGGQAPQNWVIETFQLRSASPETEYQAYVEVRFDCNEPAPQFKQPGEKFVTDPRGNAHGQIKVYNPGDPRSPVPVSLVGQVLCYTYTFEGADGSYFATPPTYAKVDCGGGPPDCPQRTKKS
jgi:hypothetical protein